MNAIVANKTKGKLGYLDIPQPIPNEENELLVDVVAVAVTNYDKAKASGTHYSNMSSDHVVGSDCVCILPDGSRAYAIGNSGTMAEKAVIDKRRMVRIPAELDNATAAALPNAVIGAAMGILYRAEMQPGDVVLINGATGFTGRVAVQLAKFYGASKVVVTGRNEESLKSLLLLGADQTISLLDTSENILNELKSIHAVTPFNVVIDYLWGASAQLILKCLSGNGTFSPRTRYVSVGSMSGDELTLSAAILRSVNLTISGSGIGAWTREQIQKLITQILPDAFDMAAKGAIKIEVIPVGFHDIIEQWDKEVLDGQRLVVVMDQI